MEKFEPVPIKMQELVRVIDPDPDGGITMVFQEEPIKMQELVRVIDPDPDGGITMVFQEDKTLKIRVVDGQLVSEFA